jgi:hypothetical protein
MAMAVAARQEISAVYASKLAQFQVIVFREQTVFSLSYSQSAL